jgi:hypothetical protein
MTGDLFITTAGNTEVPCYLLLRELGYEVSRREVAGEEVWAARGPGGHFQSVAGLPALLGLVRLAEVRGADWRAPDPEIDAFLSQFYPDTSARA